MNASGQSMRNRNLSSNYNSHCIVHSVFVDTFIDVESMCANRMTVISSIANAGYGIAVAIATAAVAATLAILKWISSGGGGGG